MLRTIVMKALLMLLCCTSFQVAVASQVSMAADNGNVKWGRLAMEEAAKAYSDAAIIDYKYEGRRIVSGHIAEERFRLWLRERQEEFALSVIISIETPSEKLIKVRLEERRHR